MIVEIYNPQDVEKKTQKYWQEKGSFRANEDLTKEKFYCLAMFPYPSGYLHMGHVRNYTLGDVIARYQRMLGKNVMQPVGWDAFGLPAENAAILNKVAPAEWTYKNIEHMRNQVKRLGFAYDWNREIATCTPEYYKWEQWLFIKMLEKGLIYRKDSMVNWDPVDQTVLANEQVIDGRGWRSGALVERKKIPQWFLKITDYAEELLADLSKLEGWPEKVKTMQQNWIGRSEGVEIKFLMPSSVEAPELMVYTTRADTLFGVTFLAVAAEHPVLNNVIKNNAELSDFVKKCQQTKVAEADMETMEKKGMDTGLKAIHPFTQKEIPVWVTNYVLMDYGSGAVMAVPAHDQRDYEFAKKYNIQIKQVIKPDNSGECDLNTRAFIDKGVLINSDKFSGITSSEAIESIANTLKKNKLGEKKVNYRLRDWGVSRQRYWGAPIPMVYCDVCGAVPVPLDQLPVILPEDVDFTGEGSPIKTMPEFYETVCPVCGKKAKRETDTFDTFMESSWYYARFACPDQKNSMLDDRAKYWTPVDQYVGGIEHACMHLLYARFIHKVLRDMGLVNSDEPFTRLLTQGMVLKDGTKMSKSKGNTVDPQALIDQFGADTARTFSIFASPPEQSLEWSDTGVEGVYRFLKRIWAFAYENQEKIINENIVGQNEMAQPVDTLAYTAEQKATRHEVHSILKQACFDMERLQLNTVVSACMKLMNTLSKVKISDAADSFIVCESFSILLLLLNPIAPHITQYLWKKLHYGDTILHASFPKPSMQALKVEAIELIVQVNGKRRAAISVPVDTDEETIKAMATNDENVKKFTEGKNIQKIVVVPGRLVNIVVI
jgi:leucyl-tRNA synthetase